MHFHFKTKSKILFFYFIIGSTQYYITRLNLKKGAQREQKKMLCDSKNWYKAKEGEKMLNQHISVN